MHRPTLFHLTLESQCYSMNWWVDWLREPFGPSFTPSGTRLRESFELSSTLSGINQHLRTMLLQCDFISNMSSF